MFAALLVPPFGAVGGAVASVLGDALLCLLIYRRLRVSVSGVMVGTRFLARVLAAALLASVPLFFSQIPDFAAAALAGALFLGVGYLIGMVPSEVREAFPLRRLLGRRGP